MMKELIKPQSIPNENVKEKTYYGYTFRSDGTVFASNGRKLKAIRNSTGNLYVILTIDGKQQRINLPKLMYGLFYGEFIDRSFIITFKDNDKENITPGNLDKISLKDYYHQIDKKCAKRKIMSNEQIAEIRQKYGCEDSVNQFDKKGCSIRDLAEEYNCSINTIQRILNNTY